MHLFLYYTMIIPSMYLFGHFAVAYFIVPFLERYFREDYNLPSVLIASILPDVDLFFTKYIIHRGPTHSIISMTLLFVLLYTVFRKGISFYIALLSHSLIGDYFTVSGIQLFWPITCRWYRAPRSLVLTGTELLAFELTFFMLMFIHYLIIEQKRRLASNIENLEYTQA